MHLAGLFIVGGSCSAEVSQCRGFKLTEHLRNLRGLMKKTKSCADKSFECVRCSKALRYFCCSDFSQAVNAPTGT